MNGRPSGWAMPVVWQVNDWKGHVWALTPYIDCCSLYCNVDLQRSRLISKPPATSRSWMLYGEAHGVMPGQHRCHHASWGLTAGNCLRRQVCRCSHFQQDLRSGSLEWITSYSHKYDVNKIWPLNREFRGEGRGTGSVHLEKSVDAGPVGDYVSPTMLKADLPCPFTPT